MRVTEERESGGINIIFYTLVTGWTLLQAPAGDQTSAQVLRGRDTSESDRRKREHLSKEVSIGEMLAY